MLDIDIYSAPIGADKQTAMTTDLGEAQQPIKQQDDDTDDEMVDPSKPSKSLMKAWGLLTRITLIVYLCASAMVYRAFSRNQVDECFGFCDHLSPQKGGLSPAAQSYSNSASKDAPEMVEKKARLLPSFADGGVIFFLHVPKTGGISIRKALSEGDGKFILSDDRRKFERAKHEIDTYVKYGTDGEVITIELHASSSPTLLEVAERLRIWRKIASKRNVPFFAFTVLREPLSFMPSWFNFFHGMDHGDERMEYFEEPAEHDFLDAAVFNPQCGFLVEGDVVFFKKKEKLIFQRSDCDHAYAILLEQMDWIGTTSTITNETFPILKSLVGSNTNADHLVGEGTAVKNKSPPKIRQADLSPEAVKQIRRMTLWDKDLYEKAKRDFQFDQIVMLEAQTAL